MTCDSDIAYESDKKSGYFQELWNLDIQIIEQQQAKTGEKNTEGTEAEFSFKLQITAEAIALESSLWVQKQRQPFTGGVGVEYHQETEVTMATSKEGLYANQLVSIHRLHPHVFTLHACWASPCLLSDPRSSQSNIPSPDFILSFIKSTTFHRPRTPFTCYPLYVSAIEARDYWNTASF